MATLEDSFLADLDELSDNETEIEISKLENCRRFTDVMQKKVEEVLDSEYKLIVDWDNLLVKIENKIIIIHDYIRHNYRLKLPDLGFLVRHAIDYARVVKRIGNETDLTLVDLKDLLPSSTIMAITINAATRGGKPLGRDVLKKTIEACDQALELDSLRKKVVDFVETKVRFVAPNLSEVVGSKVAAKLMVNAGGLSALANEKSFVGSLVGYLEETEIVRNIAPEFRFDACELLAAKLSLVARVDFNKRDSSGAKGRAFRDKILRETKKWQKEPKLLGFFYPKTGKRRQKRLLRNRYEIDLFDPRALGQCSGTQSTYFSEFETFSKKI